MYTFVAHSGLFKYLRMPFWVMNVSGMFHKEMNVIMVLALLVHAIVSINEFIKFWSR